MTGAAQRLGFGLSRQLWVRAVAAAAGLALGAGYAGLAFAETPAAALAAAALAGAGNGAMSPTQSALIAALAPPEVRHRAAAVSRVAVNIGIGLGGAVGGAVAGFGLHGFVALFLANAATYLLYVVLLLAVVGSVPRPQPAAGGYRALARDRPFLRLAATNVALIAVGWGVLAWLVAPYADQLRVASQLIGLLLLANAATVVVAQVPLVAAVEGRSRAGTLAFAAALCAGACLLVVVAGGPRRAPPTASSWPPR
jgi:MFS family permease